MNRSGKIHALLSTARVANIPSVVSNVWLGVVVGLMYRKHPGPVPWMETGCLMFAGVCLYVAGNFFNDWMDDEWDRKHRPERALPQGLFSRAAYRNTALVLVVLGIAAATWVSRTAGLMAAAIAACVLIYTIWHKRAAWAVIPMGLCRALLPVMGVSVVGLGLKSAIVPLAPAAALFCYIVGLSLSARNESRGGEQTMPLIWFLVPPVSLGLLSFLWTTAPVISIIGCLPYGLWLWRCRKGCLRPVPRYVSALLAGIPLVDWILLLPVSFIDVVRIDASSDANTACFAIPPVAFLLALCLQRVAPAT